MIQALGCCYSVHTVKAYNPTHASSYSRLSWHVRAGLLMDTARVFYANIHLYLDPLRGAPLVDVSIKPDHGLLMSPVAGIAGQRYQSIIASN